MSRDTTTTIDPDEIDALLAAADPLPAARAATLPVRDAQEDLCRTLLAQPRAAVVSSPARRPQRSRRRLLPRLALAVVVLFAISMAALSLGKPGEKAGTVWAAELVRLAEASPLVLLQAPGWHVAYADEQSAEEGELQFAFGATPGSKDVAQPAASGREAALNWRGGDLTSWKKDRAGSAQISGTAPVLDTTAHVYQYIGGPPGRQDITALWRQDDRVLEFRAGVADMAAFKALLAQLEQVDTDTWLSALPASVIKAADRAGAVAEMLRGIPLPPGFDPSTIKGATLTKDRYQLGAAVSGTVACTWFRRWSDARRRGDEAGVRAAIAAMATAKHWPILKEMAVPGDYPEVMWQLVEAMPSGRWYGRPLAGDVDPALGCTRLGISLG